MVFQQKPQEKADLIVKMTGPAMIRPIISDFWKASQDLSLYACIIDW